MREIWITLFKVKWHKEKVMRANLGPRRVAGDWKCKNGTELYEIKSVFKHKIEKIYPNFKRIKISFLNIKINIFLYI